MAAILNCELTARPPGEDISKLLEALSAQLGMQKAALVSVTPVMHTSTTVKSHVSLSRVLVASKCIPLLNTCMIYCMSLYCTGHTNSCEQANKQRVRLILEDEYEYLYTIVAVPHTCL